MTDDTDVEFLQAGSSMQAVAVVSAWPLYAALALSAVAAGVAILNELTWSLIAYGGLLVVGVALLIVYRISAVRASMSANGAAVGVMAFERVAVAAIILGCLANGIVIGLWVGSWELWFQ